jgi:hypothetical protein
MAAFTTLFGMLSSAATAAGTAAAAAAPTLASALPTLGATAVPTAAATAAETALATGVAGNVGAAGGMMGTGGFMEAGATVASEAAAGAGGVAAETGAAQAGSTIFSTKNAIGAAEQLVSKGMQYKNQQKMEQAQARAQSAQGKMASLKARNERLGALSAWRIAEGGRQAAAGTQGMGAKSSGLAQGGGATALAKQWGESISLEGLAAKAGNQMQNAMNYGNATQGWQTLGNFLDSRISPTIFQNTNNPVANLSTNKIEF